MDPHTYSPVEALESRVAPATITVDFTGGILKLTSDDGDHGFTLTALDPTTIELEGLLDTVFQQGSDPTTNKLRLTGPIKSLTATLGSGGDSITTYGLNIAGDVSINMGGGTNNLEMVSLTTKGSLEITGGAAHDGVILGNGSVVVRKDLSLQLGDGTNSLLMSAIPLQVGGDLTYTGGFGIESAQFSFAKVVIGGDATFTFGAGNVTLSSLNSNIKVGRDLLFDSTGSLTGETSQFVIASGLVNVHRDLICRDGAANSQISVSVAGNQIASRKFTVETGTGTYAANLQGMLGKGLIDFDASASSGGTFSYNGLAGASGQIVFTGSDGDDSFIAGGTNNKLFSITANLGGGHNQSQLEFLASTIKGITINSGGGEDDLSGNFFGSKVTGSISIDNGAGPANTAMQLQNAIVNGEIRVINGSGTGSGNVTIVGSSSKIGSISYTTETTTSSFSLEDSTDLAVKGTIRVTGGAGGDNVNLGVSGGRIGKGIILDLGDGSNSIVGDFSGLFTKSLIITGGSGGDNLSLSGDGNLGVVNLSFDTGNNTALFNGAFGFLTFKAFTFSSTSTTDSDAIGLARVQVLGKFNAKYGGGTSLFQVNDSIFGSVLTVDTGAGGDTINIDTLNSGTGVVFTKSAVLTLGEGNDMLTIGGNGTTQLLTTKSKFRADGGNGSDTLTNSANNIFAKEPEFISFE
jgi:hypothetical protein